jgi:hypothetical protein
MRLLLVLFITGGLVLTLAAQPAGSKLQLVGDVQKIWDKGNHNAFTDLVRFQDKWYCVFREGTGHAAGAGKIRVLVSDDGQKWESAALLEKHDVDLRDPHISITPDGRLMINGGAAWPAARNPVKDHYSFVSFSKDGKTWTETQRVLNSWQWLWRVTWHKGNGYGVAYTWEQKDKSKNYFASLYKTGDGLHYEKVTDLGIPQTTEATVRFDGDTMLVLQRRDGTPNTAALGTSAPPYTKFTWIDLGMYYGGPNFIKSPDGQWWAAGRIIKGSAKTVLCRLDIKAGKLDPVLELPSGGDTSYPGLVWHEGQLWVCYYSSHEKKSSIYLAKVKGTGP